MTEKNHMSDVAQQPGMRGALVKAEAAFESIRLTLVNHLEEPERSAFWKAVTARDDIRAALASQPPAAPVETDSMAERAKRCTYGNPDCPKCNPPERSSAANDGEPVAWLYESWCGEDAWGKHFSFDKPAGNQWQRNIVPLYRAVPQPTRETTEVLLEVAEPLAMALIRCQTVLANMAEENEGAVAFFCRWPINHEPLRADAKNLLPILSQTLSTYHAAFMKIERQTSSPLSRPHRACEGE